MRENARFCPVCIELEVCGISFHLMCDTCFYIRESSFWSPLFQAHPEWVWSSVHFLPQSIIKQSAKESAKGLCKVQHNVCFWKSAAFSSGFSLYRNYRQNMLCLPWAFSPFFDSSGECNRGNPWMWMSLQKRWDDPLLLSCLSTGKKLAKSLLGVFFAYSSSTT